MFKQRNQQGSTLIEVLVAMGVFGFSILGASQSQINSLRINQAEHQQFIANNLLSNLNQVVRSYPQMRDEGFFDTFALDASGQLTAQCNPCDSYPLLNTLIEPMKASLQNLPEGQIAVDSNENGYTVEVSWLADRDNKANSTPNRQTVSYNVSI